MRIRTLAVSLAVVSLSIAAALAGFSGGAAAQGFPSKRMTVIMPTAPSTGYYIAMRQMADQIQAKTGSTIVLESVTGGSGYIAPARVKRAETDGHTIGMIYSSPMTLGPLVSKDVQYDPLKDFTYIALLSRNGMLIVTGPNGPGNLQELIALAKARPNTVKTGVGAVGTRVAMLQLEAAAGIKLFQVPYKSAAQANTAAMSGEVDLSVTSPSNAVGNIKAGTLKPVFVGGRRSPILPQVGSVSELYPNLEFISWYGLYGPTGMPSAAVDWYFREWTATLKDPKIAELLVNTLSEEIVGGSGQVLLEQVRRELAANAAIVKQHNITE